MYGVVVCYGVSWCVVPWHNAVEYVNVIYRVVCCVMLCCGVLLYDVLSRCCMFGVLYYIVV